MKCQSSAARECAGGGRCLQHRCYPHPHGGPPGPRHLLGFPGAPLPLLISRLGIPLAAAGVLPSAFKLGSLAEPFLGAVGRSICGDLDGSRKDLPGGLAGGSPLAAAVPSVEEELEPISPCLLDSRDMEGDQGPEEVPPPATRLRSLPSYLHRQLQHLLSHLPHPAGLFPTVRRTLHDRVPARGGLPAL